MTRFLFSFPPAYDLHTSFITETKCVSIRGTVLCQQTTNMPLIIADWVVLDVWIMSREACTTVSWRKRDGAGQRVHSHGLLLPTCFENIKKDVKGDRLFVFSQKISVQEYFLGNMAQKSEQTETGGSQFRLVVLKLFLQHLFYDGT